MVGLPYVNPIYPGLNKNLLTLGAYGPWLENPEKHGSVSKGGIRITLNPKKYHPRSSGCLRHNLKMSRQTALVVISPEYEKIFVNFHRIMEMSQNFQETSTTKS